MTARKFWTAIKTTGAYLGAVAFALAAYAGLVNVNQNAQLSDVQQLQESQRLEADVASCEIGNRRAAGIRDALVEITVTVVASVADDPTPELLDTVRAEARRIVESTPGLTDRDCSTIPGLQEDSP